MINHVLQDTTVPALGFGTFKMMGEEASAAVQIALAVGYRHIDTAQMYDNEADVGAGIARSGIPREEIFLTTKIWHTHLHPDDVRTTVREGLGKLRTDYVDLLLIHWPNPEVPLSDTLEALVEAREKGQARNIGVSNFPVALMREAVEVVKAPIFCNQVEYHPFLNQAPVLDYARSKDVLVTAHCPTARRGVADNAILQRIGQKYGKTPYQAALRWLVQQDGVAAIPKSSREETIRENFDIFDFSLTGEEMAEIDALRGGTRLVKPAHAPIWDPVPV